MIPVQYMSRPVSPGQCRLTSHLGRSGGEVSAAHSVEATIEATADAIEQPSCRFSRNNLSSRRTSLEICTNTLSSRIDEALRSFRKTSYLEDRLIADCISTVSVKRSTARVEVVASLLHNDELKQHQGFSWISQGERRLPEIDDKAGADQNKKGELP